MVSSSCAQDLPGAGLVGARQAQDELVPAVPAQQVGAAQPAGPAGGQLAQQGVAGAVALPVVDHLEVVEVEDREAQRLAGPVRRGPGCAPASASQARRLATPVSGSVAAAVRRLRASRPCASVSPSVGQTTSATHCSE